MKLFNHFPVDLWTVWGFTAQGLFFASFLVQWYKSEKVKISYLPKEFWYLRLTASIMLIVYVFQRQDLVFLIGTILQIIIYARNINLIDTNAKR